MEAKSQLATATCQETWEDRTLVVRISSLVNVGHIFGEGCSKGFFTFYLVEVREGDNIYCIYIYL